MLWLAYVLWTNKTLATMSVWLVALVGDHVVEQDVLTQHVRAIADNMTHGIIGLLSWHIVTAHLADLPFAARLGEIVLCGLLASAIDLDHFAAAGSLRIQVLQARLTNPPP